jgi:signal transduction histidine kinase
VADLLALARGGDAVGSTGPVSVPTLARECRQSVATREATPRRRHRPDGRSGRARLRQSRDDLFIDAVAHGGTAVTVSVGDVSDGFYVADDGVGIPEGKREQIFGVGYSTAEDGTGFGLQIVEQIVAAHGWAIRVTDGDDGRARFESTGVDTHEQ